MNASAGVNQERLIDVGRGANAFECALHVGQRREWFTQRAKLVVELALLGGRPLQRFSIEIDQGAKLPREHSFERVQRFGQFRVLHARLRRFCE